MPTTLTYGCNTICQLEDIEATHLRPQSSDAIETEEIAAALQAQLAKPLGFPPLSQCTIPGDTIVVAVEHGVPQLIGVVDGALQSLADAGAEMANVTVLLSGDESQADTLRTELTSLGHVDCAVGYHDPNNEKEMAFLGVSQSGLALRLNRQLCDADFVLPLGVTSAFSGNGKRSRQSSNLYPAFSDTETIARLAAATAEHFPGIDDATSQEIDDCYRQLGAQLSVCIVPNANDQIAAIVAGECVDASRAANDRHGAVWQLVAADSAKLVIATIAGAQQQNWGSVGRAIVAAESLLEPDGAIVLCTELSEPPDRALLHLVGNEDPLVIQREILRTPSTDCGPAMVLCRALERHTIYLRSQLKPALVESLGMMPLDSDQEVERLSQTLQPCTVLEDAHWLQPTVALHDEGNDE